MELLDFPPFLVDRGDLSAVARQIAAYQIQQADAAVFVGKDPTGQKAPHGETFQPSPAQPSPASHRLLIRQLQLIAPYKVFFFLVFFAYGHQAVVQARPLHQRMGF